MSMEPTQPTPSQLDRIEGKLDRYLERLTTVETDQRWLKASSRFMAGVLMAVMGKLAHLTFFKS